MLIFSPAKVNLFLRVIGERPDGYHSIVSLMQAVTVYDEITLEVDGGGIRIECDSAEVPRGRRNLCWKAAEAVLREAGVKVGVFMDIRKIIPVAGGLGGGSSDAASVIMALNEILRAGFAIEKLMEIGSAIGSDVAFFLLKSPAIARGRGETLEKVKLPPLFYILVNPGFAVSARWAYENLRLTKKDEGNILKYLKDALKRPEDIAGLLENDLEEAVLRRHPVVGELKRLLMAEGADAVLMSGSGPTVFGLFVEEEKAMKAYRKLKEAFKPPSRIFFARGL